MKGNYTSRDLVRLASSRCAGCGDCCRNMGDSIRLDPYDAYMLSFGLHKPFQKLIENEVGFSVANEQGLVLPHLQMKKVLRSATDDGQQAAWECTFLGVDGKCRIHSVRPGVCRLFPLGRQYGENGITYFDLEACDMPGKSKVRVDKWLGIPDLDDYHAFKEQWHSFCKRLSQRLAEEDQDTKSKINTLMLHMFFMTAYDGDFYESFEVRRKQVEQILL